MELEKILIAAASTFVGAIFFLAYNNPKMFLDVINVFKEQIIGARRVVDATFFVTVICWWILQFDDKYTNTAGWILRGAGIYYLFISILIIATAISEYRKKQIDDEVVDQKKKKQK